MFIIRYATYDDTMGLLHEEERHAGRREAVHVLYSGCKLHSCACAAAIGGAHSEVKE